MAHILIIDDKVDITNLVADILADDGHITTEAHTIAQAEGKLKIGNYDVIIVDIWLDDGNKMDGIGFLRVIRKNYPQIPIIMISGHATAETAALAMKIGAYDFMEKPFKSDKISFIVRKALGVREANDNYTKHSDNNIKNIIVGKNTLINNVREQCIKISKGNSRVIINGAFGTGKRLVAKTIHNLSLRQNGLSRFVEYHPYNKTEQQIQNDIQGNNNNLNIFELSQHGTLVFYDIHKFSLKNQEIILEKLQNNIFKTKKQEIEMDLRIICTTSLKQIDFDNLLKFGQFNEDLFNRISINKIFLPELKDMLEDFQLFINHFFRIISKNMITRIPIINQETISLMLSYNWPGNMIELFNLLRGFIIDSINNNIENISVYYLPRKILEFHKISSNEEENLYLLSQKAYREAKKAFEQQYIATQLKKFNGSISKTAKFIGLERTALHRKIKDLKILVKK
ncbi:sigma-54-dependent transcriptional regulator [Lyticum sinuosum]|uniref:Putative response regulator NtrX-like n=1 Tax=Lyticum sinuosum TaxID=1332059 RepID=A0AAE4VME2_9RICK|nr:sigma-54 dependent transcriptional regulator [Lyticum sinuosum]MDZ5761409.1 Sigma-54-dependent Fis family transcriptional regulator [Lyticum sinuosum]